jgi:type IV pilus assembly protein PilC
MQGAFMQKFSYIAVDSSGKETRGVVEAASQSQAISKVREQKLFPTAIGPVGDAAPTTGVRAGPATKKSGVLNMQIRLPSFLRGRVKAKDLMTVTRQLATLVDAGLPLLRGLRVLLRQTRTPALREALEAMGQSVESGSTFSEALAQHPRIFDNLYVNMVRAGEAGGVLEVVLTRLAEFMEKAERIKNKVKSAMIYPTVVLIAAVGILTFLLTKIIPKFEEIFKDLLEGKSLPGITQFVIAASHGMSKNLPMVALIVGAIVGAITLWKRTQTGRYALDRFKLSLPVFGTLIRRSAIARLTRTLGTLLSSGVPVLQALTIVRDTSGNAVIARAIQHVHDSVKEGESMTAPMEASKVFPPMVISMVEVGEETGALPDMLIRIANTFDDEVDNAVAGLTSIIEPIMIIFLAVIVGTIVIAMFLPLVKIISVLSQSQG